MKRILSLLVASAAVLSCSVMGSDDVIYDIAPINPYIYVYDSDGRNLLAPGASEEESLDVSRVTATWRGNTYKVEQPDGGYGDDVTTKFYRPYFYGLRVEMDRYGKCMFSFGELDGMEEIDNEDLVINWGDGTSDTMTIFNKFKWKADGSPSITRRFYVNGQKQDSDIAVFTFVK